MTFKEENNVICKDLVSWVARKQEFFCPLNVAKLVVGNTFSEQIIASMIFFSIIMLIIFYKLTIRQRITIVLPLSAFYMTKSFFLVKFLNAFISSPGRFLFEIFETCSKYK